MTTNLLARVTEVATAPSDPARYAEWVQLGDAISLLEDNAEQEDFIAYAALPHCFIHTVLVPAAALAPLDIEDLLAWDLNAHSSWGISYSTAPTRRVSISPPLDHTGSKQLDQGEQLVFVREFEGRLGDHTYIEVLQKFAHVFGLHYTTERNAYCRLDEQGDLEDVLRIFRPAIKNETFGGTIVTFRRDLLDEYMALTDSVAVRAFDFTRFRLGTFIGWPTESEREYFARDKLYYHALVISGHASYMRGVQIVRPQISKEQLLDRFLSPRHRSREYASFLANDFKNRVVTEISTDPKATANYFTPSELPFEMSPAFFNPEVLQRYKADSDKYKLDERSISCRGAWHLETYDINEAGQVFTYIVYLRRLPFREQLHWKAHNERPKAPISKRAIKSDFEGDWDLDYDALESLKSYAHDLDRRRVQWWTLRSDKTLDQLHYPVTQSADEWANELLHLDQLVVEGFEEKWLREKANSLGRTPAANHRSLKLVEECLIGLGFEDADAKALTAPLHRAHELRSKVKGHAGGSDALALKQQALAQHQTYPAHFRALCGECDQSLRAIGSALD